MVQVKAHHSTSTTMIQMYYTWVQAVDKGELAGLLCYLDVVDHGMLLNKLKLYGLDEEAIMWMSDCFLVS